MGNNWEDLLKAFVPLVFMAIWAITSLLNRDGKAKGPIAPQARPNLPIANRPRPTEPTLRFGNPNALSAASQSARPPTRPAVRSAQDEIVILSSTVNSPRTDRTTPARRPSKGRPSVPERRAEPTSSRTTRLAGVSQNVNQQLANTSIQTTPLSGLTSVGATGALGLGTAPTGVGAAMTATSSEAPPSAALRALSNPARLREVFILNEILQPPVALRSLRSRPGSGSSPR